MNTLRVIDARTEEKQIVVIVVILLSFSTYQPTYLTSIDEANGRYPRVVILHSFRCRIQRTYILRLSWSSEPTTSFPPSSYPPQP